MANIFVEEPTYVTLVELTESSRDSFLSTTGEDDKKKILIRQAELIIDSIIVSYGEKEDPEQGNIFPIKVVGIPLDIKKATIRLCENIYSGGELESVSSGPLKGSMVKSEKYGDHQVTYQDENVKSNVLASKNKYITSDIELYLKKYINNIGVRFSKGI